MLTERGRGERKWGWLPTLRSILESERVPDHYFGQSSMSDNVFDRIRRLMEINILVDEHRAQIIEILDGSSRAQMMEDLLRLRAALRSARDMFQKAEERVEKIMSDR